MEKTGLKPIDELVELASAGNGLAFTALWDRHIDQLRAYINSYFKGLSSPDVDDICSRSFEKAFRQIQNFDTSKGLFSTWLKTIARNTALDLLQSEARIHPRNQYVSLDGQTRAASEANGIPTIDNPLDSIIKDEDKQKKETYIEALPELYREEIRQARLIANPGCYVTSILLPTTALLRAGVAARPLPVASGSAVAVATSAAFMCHTPT